MKCIPANTYGLSNHGADSTVAVDNHNNRWYSTDMSNNSGYPQIGDIWLSENRDYHMLIIGTDNDGATCIYRILEHGGQYRAGRDWITVSPPPKIGGYEIICSTAEPIKDIPTNLSC